MKFDESGFEVRENLVAPAIVQTLLAALIQQKLEPLRGGIRRIEQRVPQVASLAKSADLLSVAGQYLSGRPEMVRAIYFDKSPDHNWFVTWHQDRTVAVSDRFEADGWGPWSMKSGAWHVQPPIDVLQQMVTLRIHLDDATVSNGCLKIIPGSHTQGILSNDKIQEKVRQEQAIYCEVAAGGAVIMRPHILHASSKSVVSIPRRILHFEYSSYKLPEGITWSA
ncbi:phytanoyl-CoA dioxygenase family protein [Methylobacter sp. BBA5.1]|uniref:phytanoyl-CoA dioxygenase family protein n=1 Tax=Methylobacter sp. BBA5.1 TaxID=1495064 RepID=UPI00056B571B|nr:phytanoyl-CoA dioxygenase family protein [Methylobacter sp. BBA5.1]